MLRRLALASLAIGSLACASPAPQAPIDAAILEPGPREQVAVDQVIALIDTSSSVSSRSLFQSEKALLESFAASMPEGDYEVASISFGGFAREREPLSPFDRARAREAAVRLSPLAEGTPIHRAIREAALELEGRSGRAAILLYSDGVPTDEVGRPLDEASVLDAAAALREGYDGTVCFHTVQLGSDPAGAAFLQRLAQSSECGSFRSAGTVTSESALHDFQRQVFLGAAPPPPPAVAAAPRDTDGDGVYDTNDLCPGTPGSARVDDQGCWIVPGVLFATGSAQLQAADRENLDAVVRVLGENPDLRLRIDGHTDWIGDRGSNQALSERRAQAVRDYLVAAGVSSDRLETTGWGASNPIAPNETPEGMRANRRADISVIR